MAIEEYNKRSHPADSDDDEVPLAFKRAKNSSKHGQLSSAPNKISSQKREESLGRLACDESPLNGDISNSEKAKVLSTTQLSSEKCTAVSKGSLTSRSRHSSENIKTVSGIELTIDKSQGEVASSDDEKPLRANFSTLPVTAENIQKVKEGTENGSEYLEDEKSLASRLKASAGASTKKLSESEDQKPSHDARVFKPPMSTSSSSNIDAGTKKDPEDSDDDKPLLSRLPSKSRYDDSSKKSDSDDEKPLSSRLKQNGSGKCDPDTELKTSKTLNKRSLSDGNNLTKSASKKAKLSEASTTVKVKHESVVKKEQKTDGDGIPTAQKMKKSSSSDKQSSTMKAKKVTSKKKHMKKNKKKNSKFSKSMPPGSGGGQKWTTLEHNGVIFPPPYKPHGVRMLYNGQPVDLTPAQEEVATMFAVMKETDYATKPKFIENFMNDWREILGKKHVIKKFELCDFTPIYEWHLTEKEKKKQITTEEKKVLKEEKAKQEDKYMWAVVDGVKEKVGNFRVEPPGLFRGRGEHPKMGKLKRRILPRDITINIGKGAQTPECPMPGERWKEVKHDNTVTWLAFWNDPINQKESKYVFLAASSSLKGQSDKEKYEKARTLKKYIADIRKNYTKDFSSKDATKRQIAVATYLIDKLALRAGNEKIWHNNMPYNKIAERKGHQGWMKEEGPYFIFPGGGTMFPDGAEQYIEKLGQYIPLNGGVVRTALDMGCGVASFGGFLLKKNVNTLSFAPRDSHKSQIQFALERAVPAFVAMLGTRRLPFPAFSFDLVHCSRCLIPFTAYNASYFIEVDRLLRPGGYLVISVPPVQWPKQEKEWVDLQAVARALCYDLLVVEGNTVIWKKPLGDSCFPNQNEFGLDLCSDNNDPNEA